jgi:hypothetical protein
MRSEVIGGWMMDAMFVEEREREKGPEVRVR